MLTLTLGQAVFVPVMLTDTASQAPSVGVLYSNVQATVVKNDGTAVDLTLGPTDWSQITQGAYSSKGYYLLKLPASALDQEGSIHFGVAVAGVDFFPGLASVRANTEKQIYDRIGAPVLADISHDIQVISASTGSGGFGPTDRDNLLAVKAKTDNLPTDPASNTHVDAVSFTTSDRSNLGAIKLKTDNLPASPAAVSDVTGARDNVNSNVNSQASSINSNTNSRASEIKGSGFTTGDDLHAMRTAVTGINAKTTNLPADPASQSVICGTGFDSTTDSLHQLQLASSSASSGGFGVQDRADLQAIKAQADLIGTTTVASQADVNAARDTVMGIDTTNSPYNVRRTISEVYVYARNYIHPKTTNLPSDPASGSTVSSAITTARDYLAGTSYSASTDSLHQIRSQLGVGGFLQADRDSISNIYSRIGAPTGASIAADIAGVKTTGDNNRSDVIAIRAKTDNLPTDPASNTHVDLVTGGGADAWNANDREIITEIKAKTDRLPTDPASQSAGFGTTDRDVMTAIRYKTDALPVDPASTTAITNLSNKVGTPNTTIAQDIGDLNDVVLAGS